MTEVAIPRMRSIKETAKLTGLAPWRIRQWCISGEIAAVQAGATWLVNVDRLIEYLNQPHPKPAPDTVPGIRPIDQ